MSFQDLLHIDSPQPLGYDPSKTFVVWCPEEEEGIPASSLATLPEAAKGSLMTIHYTVVKPAKERIEGVDSKDIVLTPEQRLSVKFVALFFVNTAGKRFPILDTSGTVPRPFSIACSGESRKHKLGDIIDFPSNTAFTLKRKAAPDTFSPQNFKGFFCDPQTNFPVIEYLDKGSKPTIDGSANKVPITHAFGSKDLMRAALSGIYPKIITEKRIVV